MTDASTRRTLATDLHPRAQLARDEWFELDGGWGFASDDLDEGIASDWMRRSDPFTRTIQVPFPPESPASGIADRGLHPVVWYRRTVRVPPRQGMCWLLHFGAVDHHAMVWVDGSLVCEHTGGYTPFSADVTAALSGADTHVVVVRAEDQVRLDQPRGKQHWAADPEEIWYERTTGIWQPVWLEPVPRIHVSELRWTPDVEHRNLGLDVTLSAAPRRAVQLRVLIHGPCGMVADDLYTMAGDTLSRQLQVDIGAPSLTRRRDVLWSPEYPNLLSVVATLQDDGGVIDIVHSYVGMRTVGVRDGTFRLNGRPYYLRLVLSQGYWPRSHLAAPGPDELRREVELIKSLGFNGVRVHQKIEDPRFLHWCDRLGLIVWEEMPSCYTYARRTVELLVREWLEVIGRDHSHPCIVTWVPFNESWGVEWMRDAPAQLAAVRALCALTEALDGTRPVVANDGWEHAGGGIIGVHDYALDPGVLRERYGTRERLEESLRHLQPNGRPLLLPGAERGEEPVVLSEFGGITLSPDAGDEWFGYGTVPHAEALLATWESLFAAVFESEALAGFCYTQFADTRQETNGMVTADRVPKVDPRRVRRIIRAVPRSIPMEQVIRSVLNPVDVSPHSDGSTP
jgi:hypothetical protein